MAPARSDHRRFSGDPFDVLGIPRGSDAREVRAAYRRLAKQFHPDVNPSADAAERMARINWAYKIAIEHARHEGPRVYRGGSHRGAGRTERVRWYVRHRPPPAGGRLVAVTRTVHLHGLRGENANVEGLVVVENRGTGPLEGEARGVPAWVIVSPKQFSLDPQGSQMFRVSAPNRYCTDQPTQAALVFESNGGDERVALELPAQKEVLLVVEPGTIDMGVLEPGEVRSIRLRVAYRGNGLPRFALESSEPWLETAPMSSPRRTQHFRLTVRAPEEPGSAAATVTAVVAGARATANLVLRVVGPEAGLTAEELAAED